MNAIIVYGLYISQVVDIQSTRRAIKYSPDIGEGNPLFKKSVQTQGKFPLWGVLCKIICPTIFLCISDLFWDYNSKGQLLLIFNNCIGIMIIFVYIYAIFNNIQIKKKGPKKYD